MLIVGIIFAALVIAFVLLLLFWRPIYIAYKSNRFEKELSTAVTGEVVFLGDSITDLYDVSSQFPGYTTYNRGISGDATFHVLDRMDNLYQLQPSVVVLLIGTNDFLNEHRPVPDVAADYEKILGALRERCPDAAVICESVYPCDGKMAQWQQSVTELNIQIKRLAEQYGYAFADVYSALAEEGTIRMNPLYSKDGIHPNETGYQIVTEYLTPYLEEAYTAAKAGS